MDAVQAKHPGWSPLVFLSDIAADPEQPIDLRIDAAKASLPYVLPRLKQVECDPDQAVELEGRLHQARLEAAASVIANSPGLGSLAERLDRAFAVLRAGETLEGIPASLGTLDFPAMPPAPQDRAPQASEPLRVSLPPPAEKASPAPAPEAVAERPARASARHADYVPFSKPVPTPAIGSSGYLSFGDPPPSASGHQAFTDDD